MAFAARRALNVPIPARSARVSRVVIPIDREAAMTFRDFARDCLTQLSRWGYASATINIYDRVYMQFLAYLKSHGHRDDLKSFNDDTTFGFAEWLGDRGIHPNSIIKALSALSTLARHGNMTKDPKTGKRLLDVDPTKSFRWPMAQRTETKYLRPDDLRKLVDLRAPTHKRIACDLLIETGVRVGEAARLTVADFREADGRYYLAVKVKGRGQAREKAPREVPLSKALGDTLRDWLLARGAVRPDSRLLVNSEGQAWRSETLSNMIARMAQDAGITSMRVSAHKLRHTANVIARLAGVDAPTRSRLLGHSSLSSLERYEHVLPHELHDAREQATNAFQRYVGKPLPIERENDPTAGNVEQQTPLSDAEIHDSES